MMVAGAVVGVGIFVNPSEVARSLRSPRAILLAWVLGGIAAMLGGIAFLALVALRTTGGGLTPAAAATPDASTFLFALLPVFMSYGGWYTLTFLAGDVRRPERTLPIGIVGGIALVIATYAL